MEPTRTKYDLSGGSTVEVHKVFGDEIYFALVDSKGPYPEPGKQSKNVGRNEFIVVLSGEITVWINGVEHKLTEGQTALVKDGDTYRLDGVGKVLVLVNDKDGGKTEVSDIAA